MVNIAATARTKITACARAAWPAIATQLTLSGAKIEPNSSNGKNIFPALLRYGFYRP
jgi:hypothetical protein